MFYRHRLAYAHIYFLHLILAKRPRSDHIYFFKNMPGLFLAARGRADVCGPWPFVED